MKAVADAEDWDSTGPDRRIWMRRAFFVDAVGTARQDDGLGLAGDDLAPGGVEREQLRVDVQLANPARDQLAVLASEVQDDDGVNVRAQSFAGELHSVRPLPVAQCGPPAAAPPP